MESSSPQRRRDRGGDAEVNRDLQLSLRCLGDLCASAVNSLYSRAFLKALIVNNFNLHTLQLFEEPIDSLQAPFWYIPMRSSTITCFRYSFKFGSRSFVDFGSNPVNSSKVEASSLDL